MSVILFCNLLYVYICVYRYASSLAVVIFYSYVRKLKVTRGQFCGGGHELDWKIFKQYSFIQWRISNRIPGKCLNIQNFEYDSNIRPILIVQKGIP